MDGRCIYQHNKFASDHNKFDKTTMLSKFLHFRWVFSEWCQTGRIFQNSAVVQCETRTPHCKARVFFSMFSALQHCSEKFVLFSSLTIANPCCRIRPPLRLESWLQENDAFYYGELRKETRMWAISPQCTWFLFWQFRTPQGEINRTPIIRWNGLVPQWHSPIYYGSGKSLASLLCEPCTIPLIPPLLAFLI